MYKFSAFTPYALLNLSSNEVFCNNYKSFNDPFECWCIPEGGFPKFGDDNERLAAILDVWGFAPDWQSDYDKNLYAEYVEELQDYEISVDAHINRARISCFCREADNLLMWAHYADGLRGFCIEFDDEIFKTHLSGNGAIIEVNYTDAPPVLDTSVYALVNDQIWYYEQCLAEHCSDEWRLICLSELERFDALSVDLYTKMLATKPMQWSYEQEVRLVYHSRAGNDSGEAYRYPEAAVKSIIIGEKATTQQRADVANIVAGAQHYIPIKTAYRDRGSYKVLIT